MIKEIHVVNYKCEKCGRAVDKNDKFCYECGCNLKENVKYVELSDNIRDESWIKGF